jgi:hypothetical protein
MGPELWSRNRVEELQTPASDAASGKPLSHGSYAKGCKEAS